MISLSKRLPPAKELANFKRKLAASRKLHPRTISLLKSMPRHTPPMEALRTAVSSLALYDKDDESMDPAANDRKAIHLLAQTPTIVAAFDRIRDGKRPIAPNPRLGHAANFLYMVSGKKPDADQERIFDVCLILHADHELNASTFAARVTAATLSDMHSAVTSAIGALKGPLHGGANEQVMKMLLQIKDEKNVEAFIKGKLERHEKIMGFGHRVYEKNGDPRAKILFRFSEKLGKKTGEPKWFRMSTVIEKEVWEDKNIRPNVDFYSASTYHYLGLHTDIFTPIFAVSRMSGWLSHILEQYAHNRLIRPRAEYKGPVNQRVVPIARRK
jgi:citrate synthase